MKTTPAKLAVAPEPAAEWAPLDALRAWDANPRDNAAAIAKVAESIRRFGFASPIIARKADGTIIAGHTRYAAAQRLGLDRVPVRYLDLDPADAKLLALADNKLGEIATWDDGKLLAILGDLRQQGADAALVAGWSDAEIDQLLRAGGDAVLASDDPAAEWVGMPEYASEDAQSKAKVVVHFRGEADVEAFLRLTGGKLRGGIAGSRTMWFPPEADEDRTVGQFGDRAYVSHDGDDAA